MSQKELAKPVKEHSWNTLPVLGSLKYNQMAIRHPQVLIQFASRRLPLPWQKQEKKRKNWRARHGGLAAKVLVLKAPGSHCFLLLPILIMA